MRATLPRGGRAWVALAGIVGRLACGGGGSSPYQGPISVQTDVAVADVDGDGRNDLALFAAAGAAHAA
ncbi:MAG: hypothetical protein U5L05_00610 [Rubrivivax sp.]|nr:hypothetical protein [Rubrivivax sp.]